MVRSGSGVAVEEGKAEICHLLTWSRRERSIRQMARAEPQTQLSVFLANRPGVVAHVCAALAEQGINIRAMTVLDTVDIGTMRMVVDDVEGAKRALDGSGAAYVEVPVISIPIPNVEGGFAHIARVLAGYNVNIEYFYATATPNSEHTLGIFRVSDYEKALEVDLNGQPAQAVQTT